MGASEQNVAVTSEVPPNTGSLHVLDKTGDTKMMWDRNNADEVAAARKTFNDLKAKRFMAYKAEGKEGRKGEVIDEFDPSAERIIMAPPMVGG